ncbi:SoxR reducing system RseC family protein [Porphyromonadaceae bacterium OttesenSCG-928-L07]|nr:SoxR reducing system RseC family protein [Porphyromonadaceae bacterium OttesenSCG-928-L07]MDL2252042.1 SoxR reducing system RseC family protein [Odoribacter sp. OttesenSCG-928-J03]
MAKKDKIGHEGIVTNIYSNTIDVTISSQSACAGCHAKGACGMSDRKEKIISADIPAFNVNKGDKVIVYASMNHAMFSVFMAYIIPVIVIIGVLPVLLHFGFSEVMAATAAIVMVALYFFILYLNRKRLSQKIKFSIEKMQNNIINESINK